MTGRDCLRMALEGIWVNKFRSAMTMLGIIIGIAAVVAVVGLGQAGETTIIGELEKFGANLYTISVNHNNGKEWGNESPFTLEDLQAIRKQASAVQYIVPQAFIRAPLTGEAARKTVAVVGTGHEFMSMQQNLQIVKGRFFSKEEEESGQPAVVLEEKLAQDLYGSTEIIGQKIMVKDQAAWVIGVYREERIRFDPRPVEATAYVPVNYWQEAFQSQQIYQVAGTAVNKDRVEEAIAQIKGIMDSRHHVTDGYQGMNLKESIEQVNRITTILTALLGAIAGISLVVGGIGVMNIMLVSVTERTREIGVRKAMGASRRDILKQFLVESVFLCLLGGGIGALGGMGATYAIAWLAGLPAEMAWGGLAAAFAVSTFIGIFFGLYPANQAARLDPIEALRHEI